MPSNEEIVEIKKKLEEHEERISKLESFFQTKPEVIKKKVSIREFIISKKPKNDVQKTLAIGYYLENHQGFSSFNVRDLEESFRSAKEKVPQNAGDKVQLNIKNGNMMETKEKKDNLKAWVLTNCQWESKSVPIMGKQKCTTPRGKTCAYEGGTVISSPPC